MNSRTTPPGPPAAVAGRSEAPLLNIANALTVVRLVLVPVFIWLMLRSGDAVRLAAALVFALAAATDRLDGQLARSRNLVTSFGKIADPIADKALISTALICLNINGSLPVWVTIVILVREIGITIWRMFELRKGNVVPASKGGKLKTVLQTIAVTLFLIPPAHIFHYPALVVMLIAVVVTTVTGCQYIVDSMKLKKTVTGE